MELTLQILAREGMADDTDRADSIQPGARFVPEPGTSPATTYRLVSNMRDFQSLEHDWNALFERLDSPTAFQAFDWNRLWSETYIDAGARRCRLAVMTAWRADRLILVLPCVQEKHAGISRLKWMGEPVTQYGDVLVDDVPDAQEVVAAAWNEVVRLLRPDAAWLRFVRGDAAIAPLLRRLNALEVAPRRAPYLELPRDASADQFLLRYGSKNRKNRRRQMRRLQEQGTVEFAVAGIGPSAVAISRDTLALKHRWLAQRRTYSTAFANERIDRFFSSLAAHGARHAEPIHIAVNLDGRQIAAAICIGTRKRLCVHILTYDQDYSRFAVGVHALEEVIRYGIANGMTCLDFLAPQSPFKADWTDTSVAVADYALAISPLGRAYFHGFIGVARPFARVLATWWSKRNRRKN